MEGFLVAAMVLVFLVLAVLIFVGGRAWRPAAADEVSRLTASWPRLAVLVPVTGAAAGLAGRLEALLSQDYPHYQVVFSTRDAQDPATAVILSLISAATGGPGTWSPARPGTAARRITTCWRR